jgi:hypothetical protein
VAHIEPTARIESSVIKRQLRIRVEPIFRQSALMAEFKARGRISYGHHGSSFVWRPRFRRRSITAGDAMPNSIDFPATNVRVKAELPWRIYHLGEHYTKFEVLVSQNRDTAIHDIAGELLNQIVDDFLEDLRLKFYLDGNAAATSKDMHGLESFFSVSGLVTNSRVGNPNDTYAGLATTLGDKGGSWTPNASNGWPTGTGDTEYCYWSPLVVDYTNANFPGSTHNWYYQWQPAVRYGFTYLGLLQRTVPTLLLVNGELLRQMKDSLESTERFVLSETAGSNLTNVGFKTLAYEGLEVTTEYGVPDAVGYLLNLDKLELMSMQKQLVDWTSDDDITASTKMMAVDAYLNLRCDSPAFQGKLQAIS